MILPFSHTPQNSTSTPNGVDDVAQPCSPFRASCTPWLTLSEHGWVSSHERRSRCWGSSRNLHALRPSNLCLPSCFSPTSSSHSRFRAFHHRLHDRQTGADRRGHRFSPQRCPSLSPHTSDRSSSERRCSRRNRRGAPPPESKHHRPVCQGGLDRIAHLGAFLAGRCAMKTLQEAVQDYLSLRR